MTIVLQAQADNTLKPSFDAPASKETNPSLGERWAATYNGLMSRRAVPKATTKLRRRLTAARSACYVAASTAVRNAEVA